MTKHFKIAIQMDPLESINIKTDSTYILALEAQKRGHSLFHYLPENLIYENGRVSALGNAFKLFPNKKIFFKKSKTQKISLDDCFFIFFLKIKTLFGIFRNKGWWNNIFKIKN